MANPFDQFDQEQNQANPFDQFDESAQQSDESREEIRKALFPTLKERVTGETMMTERLKGIREIGEAPELNEMSLPALRSSFGLLTTGRDDELMSILKAQYGDRVSFDADEKGNTIVKFPSGEYALNMPGLSGQDVARGLFDIAAFSRAGAGRNVLSVGGKSALTEAAIEAGSEAVGGEFDVSDVAMAGVLGGAFKGAEDMIASAFRASKGRVPESQQELIQFAKEEGIPLTTTDVLPPQTFAGKAAVSAGEKVPFVGTGGMREQQQILREQAVDRVAAKYGEFSERAIVDSLKAKKDKIKSAAGAVLERVGQQLDSVGEIPLDKTKSSIEFAMEELTKPGILQSSKAVDDLSELLNTLNSAPQTYSTLKENRTAFREIVDSIDPAARSQMSSRARGLLKKVESSMTDDMLDFARNNLSPKEFNSLKKANSVWSREYKELTKTRLKNVLDKGDVTPENVMPLLFSKKGSEVAGLYKSLTTEGRKNARAAIINKVIDNVSRRASGLTPDSFMNELKKYPAQTMAFFKGEDRKQLQGLMRVLEATQRAQSAAVATKTGQEAIGAGAGISAFIAPAETLGTGATIGTLARIYESKPVRDTLLKLSSVPKGSTQFEQALSEATTALNAAAQSFREQSQE